MIELRKKRVVQEQFHVMTGNPQTIQGSWQTIGAGVKYVNTGNPLGNEIFIGYAGYSVQQTWADHWVKALYQARLWELGIRHLYAVKGPKDASYQGLEIGNSSLCQNLLKIAPPATRIIIVAHSSGSFVAHELLGQLYQKKKDQGQTAGKIIYYNLDGGTRGLNATIVNQLVHLYPVYISGKRGYSANSGAMQQLAKSYPQQADLIAIDGSHSGCTSGAKWCLHDVLINRKPYNRNTFDLRRDYGSINSAHPVNIDYLQNLSLPEGHFQDTGLFFGDEMLGELKRLEILKGYDDSTFRPYQPINRGEFAAILSGTFGTTPAQTDPLTFKDVAPTAWYAQGVAFVTSRQLMSGFKDQTFRPQEPILRAAAIVGISALLTAETSELDLNQYYDDASKIPDWARDGIKKATASGLIINYPNKQQLRPTEAMTRGEVALLIYQMLQIQERVKAINSEYLVKII